MMRPGLLLTTALGLVVLSTPLTAFGQEGPVPLVPSASQAAPAAPAPAAPSVPAAEPAAAPPGQAVTPRAANHDGFGRMVFDFDRPVNYSAEVVNGQLVVRFDREAAGDFKALLRPLVKYVRGVNVSGDRRMATFPLAAPVTVKSFVKGNSVVVDLVKGAPEAAEPAAPAAKPAETKPADAKPEVREAKTEPAALPVLTVRGGEHTGFNRIVFDWPRPVDYKVDKQGDRAVVSFNKPATVDVAGLRASLPADIGVASADSAGNGTTVQLTIPANARLRHFRSGTKVAVDVVRPANATPPAPVAGAPAVPLAPPPGGDMPAPGLKPLAAQPAPKAPLEVLTGGVPPLPGNPVMPPATGKAASGKAAEGKDGGKNAPPPADKAPPQPVTAELPSAPAAASPAQAAGQAPAAAPVSLGFSWTQPTAAAVFRRAGYLWIVFDRHQDVDLKQLRKQGGAMLHQVEQMPNRDATALRLIVDPEINPTPRREGLQWVIDLAPQPLAARMPVPVQPQTDQLPPTPRLFLPVSDGGATVALRDPEVGDQMLVVPVASSGYGVTPGYAYPEAEFPATAQGVVVIPRADGVEVKTSRGGIEVTAANGGIHVSPGTDKPAPMVKLDPQTTGLLDINSWKRGGPDRFEQDQAALNQTVAALPPESRNPARLDLARFFVANGKAAEALGVLRVMASLDPAVTDAPSYRAVRGAAQMLMGRYDLAREDLTHPSLASVKEAGWWAEMARAAMGEPVKDVVPLKPWLPELAAYPRPLLEPLGMLLGEAAIADADDGIAEKVIEALAAVAETPFDKARLAYLQGNYNDLVGNFDDAVAKWQEAEDGPSRPHRAKSARNRVELMLKMKKLTPKDAIEELEKLRFAWRSEDFEFGLLRRLGELHIAEGDYPAGLRTLRQLASNYPANKDIGVVAAEMSDAFSKLYLDGAADSLPPVTAIALYDEFRELTPSGAKGDEMIRRLADRLVAVDLLDRAAELLQQQVSFRLTGLDKARVGTQLALVHLLDHKPAKTIEDLAATDMPGLPPELFNQRRSLMARALDELGRTDEAIALLGSDEGDDAKLLRADIHWRRQHWPEAAQALEAMIVKPEKGQDLDVVTARRVLDWATALTLANDERGLTKLRRNFGPLMEKTAFKDAFGLLTSELERGMVDYRLVSSKIKEAQNFQDFMSAYRKRLQTEGLNTIH